MGNALVTGGGRGLGAALATALASDGWHVAIAGRSADSLETTAQSIRGSGGTAVAMPADITDPLQVERLVDGAETALGPLDLVVNNAGLTEHGNVWETDPKSWWAVVEVNLLGTFLCARAALSRMVPRRQGRIVNLGSTVANEGSKEQSAYAVSKAAILRLTDSLQAQIADSGIYVFAISPGRLDTDMGRSVAAWSSAPKAPYVPTSKAGELVLEIASGRLDALAGRFIHVNDDRDRLLASIDTIRKQDLYQLRLSSLADTGSAR